MPPSLDEYVGKTSLNLTEKTESLRLFSTLKPTCYLLFRLSHSNRKENSSISSQTIARKVNCSSKNLLQQVQNHGEHPDQQPELELSKQYTTHQTTEQTNHSGSFFFFLVFSNVPVGEISCCCFQTSVLLRLSTEGAH